VVHRVTIGLSRVVCVVRKIFRAICAPIGPYRVVLAVLTSIGPYRLLFGYSKVLAGNSKRRFLLLRSASLVIGPFDRVEFSSS
jgi:hypothetical protein